MQLAFQCPVCSKFVARDLRDDAEALDCDGCDWSRPVKPSDFEDGHPARCLACGCNDLWRQKDFPQRLGLLLVGVAIVLSSIAWYYMEPIWAIGILMAFALFDLALYTFMPDVLVCYRCQARCRSGQLGSEHERFDHETAERYRQEAKRLTDTSKPAR